jgi:hypothetical protein
MYRIQTKPSKAASVLYTVHRVCFTKMFQKADVIIFGWKMGRWILNWRTSRKQLVSTRSLLYPENRPSFRKNVV